MPSKTHLRIHATCCKVAIMSGALEYLERVTHNEEETTVLATDGSSEVLTNVVWEAFRRRQELPSPAIPV